MVSSKGEKSFICGVCELSFSDSSTLKIHVRTYIGEKLFQCQICNYATAWHKKSTCALTVGKNSFNVWFAMLHFPSHQTSKCTWRHTQCMQSRFEKAPKYTHWQETVSLWDLWICDYGEIKTRESYCIHILGRSHSHVRFVTMPQHESLISKYTWEYIISGNSFSEFHKDSIVYIDVKCWLAHFYTQVDEECCHWLMLTMQSILSFNRYLFFH